MSPLKRGRRGPRPGTLRGPDHPSQASTPPRGAAALPRPLQRSLEPSSRSALLPHTLPEPGTASPGWHSRPRPVTHRSPVTAPPPPLAGRRGSREGAAPAHCRPHALSRPMSAKRQRLCCTAPWRRRSAAFSPPSRSARCTPVWRWEWLEGDARRELWGGKKRSKPEKKGMEEAFGVLASPCSPV